jgi:hypothetical protein
MCFGAFVVCHLVDLREDSACGEGRREARKVKLRHWLVPLAILLTFFGAAYWFWVETMLDGMFKTRKPGVAIDEELR